MKAFGPIVQRDLGDDWGPWRPCFLHEMLLSLFGMRTIKEPFFLRQVFGREDICSLSEVSFIKKKPFMRCPTFYRLDIFWHKELFFLYAFSN